MNLFSFTGNLGKDAEVKYTQGGTAICEFSVAVKSGYGDREKTNWVRCAIFGKKAEGQLPQYLKQGTQVAISGELTLEEWEGQNGKGAALSVSVQNIDLIGGTKQQSQPNQYPNPNEPRQVYGGAHNQSPQQAPNQAPAQQPPAQPQHQHPPAQQPNAYAQQQSGFQ